MLSRTYSRSPDKSGKKILDQFSNLHGLRGTNSYAKYEESPRQSRDMFHDREDTVKVHLNKKRISVSEFES